MELRNPTVLDEPDRNINAKHLEQQLFCRTFPAGNATLQIDPVSFSAAGVGLQIGMMTHHAEIFILRQWFNGLPGDCETVAD